MKEIDLQSGTNVKTKEGILKRARSIQKFLEHKIMLILHLHY